MISSVIAEYSFSNVLLLIFQVILPFIIYILSFSYVSDNQNKWFTELEFNSKANIISGSKGIFIGSIVFILTGIASLLVIDFHHYKNTTGMERSGKKILTEIFKIESKWILHFFLFPLMILFSNLGYVVAYHSKDFKTHIALTSISLALNLYLMFHYSRTISYTILLLLLPLFVWQILNLAYYGSGLKVKSTGETETSS